VRFGNLAQLFGHPLGAFDMLGHVAERNDADRLPTFVEDRHTAELALAHGCEGLLDVIVGAAADDIGSHYVTNSNLRGMKPLHHDAHDDVAVGQDTLNCLHSADQHGADVQLRHVGRGILNTRGGIEEIDRPRHDFGDFHRCSPP
jgi:hypothetical protein